MDLLREIYSTSDLFELELVKSELTQRGIIFQIKGEQALMATNIYLTGISGASVRVHIDHREEAKEILRNLFPEKFTDNVHDEKLRNTKSNAFQGKFIALISVVLILASLIMIFFVYSY